MKSSESKYCQCLYFATNSLARKVEKMAIESWKPVSLSPSHAYLLMMAIEEPGLQPGNLADHLQLTPSTITRLVEKLEEKKLLVRITEGKIANVYPTSKAKKLLPQLEKCRQHFYETFNNILSKKERNEILANIYSIESKLAN